MVIEIMNSFTSSKFACEFKYNAGYNDSRNKDTLNFKTEHPKLMTYHSAKGLQFETVIIPFTMVHEIQTKRRHFTWQ